MKTIRLTVLGRAGNNLFRYAHARKLAELNGYELRCQPWWGEKVFTLDGARHPEPDGTEDLVIDGYCQNQQSLIYSRADCRRWFKLRPEVEEKLGHIRPRFPQAHLRRGDYKSAGYPLVSVASIDRAMAQYDLGPYWGSVTDDNPGKDLEFTGELSMLPDFVRLMRAPVLLRGNSSFSFWSSVLGDGITYAPIIDGLEGGKEHDCEFVLGNWPRLANFDFTTELHLRET